jgi:putative membrane protein
MTESITGLVLLLSAGVYVAGSLRSSAIGGSRIGAFAAGWLAVAIALLSPLHDMAEVKLSAHMAQHELLMIIAAPLFALGRPDIAVLGLIKQRRRRKIVARLMSRARLSLAAAWTLHGAAVWIWHLPVLYTAAAAQPCCISYSI